MIIITIIIIIIIMIIIITTIIMITIMIILWYLWGASFKMVHIFNMDIWPLLTGVEVDIRVTYEQKENLPIPCCITWNNSIQHSQIHLNNHVKYASWNKWVLIRVLKISTDGDRLMFRGNSFHSIGAAAAIDLLAKFAKSTSHRCQLTVFLGSQSARWGVRNKNPIVLL